MAGRWLFGNSVYDKNMVYLLNNAIDLNKFEFDENNRISIRNELKISNDTLVIGHIGRFVEQKNHRYLIDIFDEVNKINDNSILLLAGQGPLEKEMKDIINKRGLTNKVIFLGQRKDAFKLYHAFDIFVLPSLYEGLPVVGVEAQASGLKCLFSNDMTRETKVLESSTFLSILDSPKIWAEEITKKCDIERKKAIEEMRIKGYDITVEANKLEDYYLSLSK